MAKIKILNYIKDFYKIFEYIQNKNLGEINVKNNEIYIKKSEIQKLLEVNKYDTADNKLKVWRVLNFINCTEGRYTKKIKKDKKVITMVALNIEAYDNLRSVELE